MRKLICILLLSLCCTADIMAAPIPVLTDPVMVARFDAFTHALRCLKCQHQSIAESDSEFSQDMKAWLTQTLSDGRSDQEIKDMLQARFGDRIFLQPPWQMNTYVLWFLPLLLCLMGCLLWLSRVKK